MDRCSKCGQALTDEPVSERHRKVRAKLRAWGVKSDSPYFLDQVEELLDDVLAGARVVEVSGSPALDHGSDNGHHG